MPAAGADFAAGRFRTPNGRVARQRVDGIIYSSWLFIAAVGLTLIYGVMKIVNITHGSFYALGAYTAASLHGRLARARLSADAVLCGAARLRGRRRLVIAPLIERGILRFMYAQGRGGVLLLITYALFLILEDAIKLIWGVDPYFIAEPYGCSGSFDFGELTYPTYNFDPRRRRGGLGRRAYAGAAAARASGQIAASR